MRYRSLYAGLLAATILGGVLAAPSPAMGQDWLKKQFKHRQSKKNEWRNIGIGAGAIGVLGLLKHDNTLFFAGTAGALYSAYRYEQDRKSESKMERARAGYFSKDHFYRDGHRYNRKTVYKHGKKYYQFVRAD